MITPLKRLTYIGILILFFLSCSKNNSPAPVVTPVTPVVPVKDCKIIAASVVTVNGDTITKYTFKYNSDGKLSGSLFIGGYIDTISYSYNGKIIYRSVAAGTNSSVDSITINDAGLEVHDKEVVGPSIYMSDWVYDASMQLKTFTQQQDAYPPISSTYTFTNGDNTLSSSGPSQDTLAYDSSKLAVPGNLDQFFQLLNYGAMYIQNKHLLISSRHGALVTYAYTFNSDGNISSVTTTVNGVNSGTLNYTYECK
jgi:YD repeat-containing protein